MKTILISGGLCSLAQSVVSLGTNDYKFILVDIIKNPPTSIEKLNNCDYLRADSRKGSEFKKNLKIFMSKYKTKIDGLINMTAWRDKKSFRDTTYDNMRKTVETKLLGYANTIKAILPYLNKNASIINISSVLAHSAIENYAMYSAANAGVLALTRALAVELRPNVRVNSISPGGFLTANYMLLRKDWEQRLKKRQLLQSTEIAEIVLFLLSDKSSGINGAEIIADVGTSAMRAESSKW